MLRRVRRGVRRRAGTYLILCARLATDLAYIQIGHGTDLFAAMANRGTRVSLALLSAFVADSEIAYRISRR